MATILEKEATFALLASEFASFGELCRSLTSEQWTAPTCLPGWSVHDVVAHIIGTECMLLGDPSPDVDLSHLTHLRNPIAEANERWVESMRPLPPVDLLSRYDEAVERRLAHVEPMTQAEFDVVGWTPAGEDTVGRFMRIRHFDTYLHELDIRFALGLPARQDPADVASSLDEVATGLGFIVGRRASLPDGSRVRIDLTGAVARTYLVEVQGRAAVVESLSGEPTVAITLDCIGWLRRTGGRADPNRQLLDGIVGVGDPVLVAQLVENLAFTI